MPPHLPEPYWLAIIGGVFLVLQAIIAYVSSRKTDNVTALDALVDGLQEENKKRVKEINALKVAHAELQEEHRRMGLRFDLEVGVRKQAELDRDHCIGALARERTLNEGHLLTIDKLKADIRELDTQLAAANAYAAILRAEIHVLDPEHPILADDRPAAPAH